MLVLEIQDRILRFVIWLEWVCLWRWMNVFSLEFRLGIMDHYGLVLYGSCLVLWIRFYLGFWQLGLRDCTSSWFIIVYVNIYIWRPTGPLRLVSQSICSTLIRIRLRRIMLLTLHLEISFNSMSVHNIPLDEVASWVVEVAVIVLTLTCLHYYVCYVIMSRDSEAWTRWHAYRWQICSLVRDFVDIGLRCCIVDDLATWVVAWVW